jgi:molybdate transport system substrate-binding protein
MLRALVLAVTATLAWGLLGCGKPSDDGSRWRVSILAAASTGDAVRELADTFSREHGVEVRLSADDSAKLATQIVQGAPADLFLSANEQWAEHVKEQGYAAESRLLLGNALVLVVPRGNPAGIRKPEDLISPKVRRVAVAGPTVPAGIYARQALRKLRLWDKLSEQEIIVSGENVRVALAYVERGEAEAAVVYATDARISDRVEMASTFPAAAHEPIRYPLVLLKAGARREPARKLYEYLQSPRAAEVFRKHGFTWLSQQ